MSSSEELSQYESKDTKNIQSTNGETQDGWRPAIPKDMFGFYGVHVSNLPSGVLNSSLEKAFSVVGCVKVCKIMDKKHFPVHAFVKFSLLKEAQDALLKFDGYKLNGSVLAVRPAYVSNKYKGNHSQSPKNGHSDDTSSEEGRDDGNRRKQKEKQRDKQRTTYVMGSSDCRVKDGRLSDSDVVMFNGMTGKVSPPRDANGGRLLAPRFRKDFPPKTSVSNTSQQCHGFQDLPPSSSHMSGTSSSAFRPYQGNLQESNLLSNGPVDNGVRNVAFSLSNLELSSPEMKYTSPSNHSQENGSLTWQQGGAQGVTSWSHTGGTGIMSWSNSRERPMNNPGRKDWSPQAKSGVSSWRTADVVQYFCSSDCAEYAGFFQEQEIDGKALLLLNRDTLLHFMKVGPALKVLQLIDELRSCCPPRATSSNGW